MRKLLSLILALSLMLIGAALAEETESPAPDWAELDSESCVLTLRLPANATTGYEWGFEISDPEILELLTMEYVADENEADLAGAGGSWVASFKATFEKAGAVTLTLNYARSWEDAPIETRTLELWVSENSQVSIEGYECAEADA